MHGLQSLNQAAARSQAPGGRVPIARAKMEPQVVRAATSKCRTAKVHLQGRTGGCPIPPPDARNSSCTRTSEGRAGGFLQKVRDMPWVEAGASEPTAEGSISFLTPPHIYLQAPGTYPESVLVLETPRDSWPLLLPYQEQCLDSHPTQWLWGSQRVSAALSRRGGGHFAPYTWTLFLPLPSRQLLPCRIRRAAPPLPPAEAR